jgi:3-isopropylmalate dehydratase small subunit
MQTTPETIKGRVWKFGHNLDTDAMAPWSTITAPWEQRRPFMMSEHPEFMKNVQPGDLIVAGRNFGCGSSREQAPENLKLLGIAAVVAESFGRIYFRNCIAMAFPHLVCPGILDATEQGDQLEIDTRTASIRNLTRNTEHQALAYAPEMMAIVQAGGLIEMLRQRMVR